MGEGLGDEESSEFEFRAERKDRKGNHKTQQNGGASKKPKNS